VPHSHATTRSCCARRAKVWLELVREDFAQSVRLGRAIMNFDASNGPSRRAFVDTGAALMADAQAHLQEPARRELLRAAEHAAASAALAERTLQQTRHRGARCRAGRFTAPVFEHHRTGAQADERNARADGRQSAAPGRHAADPRKSMNWPNPSIRWPIRFPAPRPNCAPTRWSSSATSRNAPGSCTTWLTTTR
jgi:hypothetical protein